MRERVSRARSSSAGATFSRVVRRLVKERWWDIFWMVKRFCLGVRLCLLG